MGATLPIRDEPRRIDERSLDQHNGGPPACRDVSQRIVTGRKGVDHD